MLLIIKNLTVAAAVSLGLMLLLTPSLALADCADPQSTQEATQCGTNNVSGNTEDAAEATDSINSTIEKFINILSVIVGVIAVIMIIVAGFRYITSGGQADKVASAKTAIVYAIIGLIIVALAQTISQFVLKQTTTTSSSGSQSQPAGGCQGDNPDPSCGGN